MRVPIRINYFDFVFSFFTSFGYFKTQREHQATISNVFKNLKPGGTFVIDFMNAFRVKKNLVLREEKEVDGIYFDLTRRLEEGRIVKEIRFEDEGDAFAFKEEVWGFEESEMREFIENAGFQNLTSVGNYRLEPYDERTSDRLIIIAQKPL